MIPKGKSLEKALEGFPVSLRLLCRQENGRYWS